MSEPAASSAKTLRALRARAHALKPVIWISQNGVSEGAMREVDRALTSHELIKIHAALDDRREREQLLASICAQLGAQAVQVIGKMLVAFRPRPEPAAAEKPARKAERRTAASGPGGTSRPARPKRPRSRSAFTKARRTG